MTERRRVSVLEAIGRIDVFGHSMMAEGGASDLDKGSMHKAAQFFPARFNNQAWGGAAAMIPGLPTTAQSGIGNVRAGWGHVFHRNPNHTRTPSFDTNGNPIAGYGGNTTFTTAYATGQAVGASLAVASSTGFSVGKPVLLKQATGSFLDEVNYVSGIPDATHIQLYRVTANAYSIGDAVVSIPDFYACERQLVLLEYDGIDASWMGMTTWSATFPEVYRAIIARLRCAAHFDIDCKLIRNTAGTAPTKTSVANGYGSGSDPFNTTAVAREMTTTSSTTVLTIDIPSNFEGNGAMVVLFFKTKANGDGAIWTYSVDGGANSTKDTRNINGYFYNNNTGTRAANGVEMPSCVVIRGLAAGKHSITLQPTTIQGTATFMGFGIIGTEPPPMVIEYPNRLWNYTTYFGAPNYTLTDADIATMKTSIASLVAEFTPTDPMILTLDRETIIQKNVALFAAEGVHTNDRGHFEVWAALANLLTSSIIPLRNLAKCTPNTSRGWYQIGAPTDAGGQGVNLKTNWNAAPGGLQPQLYKDISTGRVDLQGEIYHSSFTDSADTVMFTLPAGHRPGWEIHYWVTQEGGPISVWIRPNGDVLIGGVEERGLGAVWISLSGISFYAEQ
jgi:hypothetical protein